MSTLQILKRFTKNFITNFCNDSVNCLWKLVNFVKNEYNYQENNNAA